jgi:hypothetical protein
MFTLPPPNHACIRNGGTYAITNNDYWHFVNAVSYTVTVTALAAAKRGALISTAAGIVQRHDERGCGGNALRIVG